MTAASLPGQLGKIFVLASYRYSRIFESFTDLVRVTVVKLQAEGKIGELGNGTLHSLLVKMLTGHQLETYTRWMNEHGKERSVLTLKDS